MDMYEGFASIYDRAMNNIPYVEWCEDICNYLKKCGITEGAICELGCGTGVMTELLAMRGYEMTGVDVSDSMLSMAIEKKVNSDLDIQYVKQDMRELELLKPSKVIFSVCDSMNYMLSEEDLFQTFQSVKENLDKDGLFIFDMKTRYCFKYIMGNEMWAEQTEDASYIWENYFYEENDTNEYMLTIFKREEDSNLYRRMEESHYQRAYDMETVKDLLRRAGLEFVESFGNRIDEPEKETSERVYIIAKVAS